MSIIFINAVINANEVQRNIQRKKYEAQKIQERVQKEKTDYIKRASRLITKKQL